MRSTFNKSPEVKIVGFDYDCSSGWGAVSGRIQNALATVSKSRKIVVIECYQGVDDQEVLSSFKDALPFDAVIHTRSVMLDEDTIRKITFPDVTNDRIFGFMTRLEMADFFDPAKLEAIRLQIPEAEEGLILIYGPGASLIFPDPDILIYADMARWEIQQRMRRNEVCNLGITKAAENIESKYKRGYFVDWRVCDRLKKRILPHCDFVMDTNVKGNPKMISGRAFFEGMEQVIRRPFSVVPYFDAGPWGGQWMKNEFELDKSLGNYAWCFNCVPEENSLYLVYGEQRFETPSINLVFFKPVELLGDPVHARFGDEFPIRFDYLDTMGGSNLSLQVHPVTEYIQQKFGVFYTQDESYYILDAEPQASVYLGLKEGIDPAALIESLNNARNNNANFEDSAFVEKWPAKKHDHFLIPGGTVHCSGSGCMVLEISATPYIFTFKLWDWGRLGMDGKPRPINIEHGEKNIQWQRTKPWVEKNLVNQVTEINRANGWREEKTGLHEREFIETRRHWFTQKVYHNTNKGVNVITLVEGREIQVESPDAVFEPFVIRYAETFIVPAAVGEYTIKPYGESEGKECATIKAFVRVNA